jgi:membrane protease YdiL (CAAX protease family)
MNDVAPLQQLLTQAVFYVCLGVLVYFVTRWLKFQYIPWPYPNSWQSALVAIGTAFLPLFLLSLISLASAPDPGEAVQTPVSMELKKSPFLVITQFILYFILFSPILMAMKIRKESWQSAGVTRNNLGKSILLGCLLVLISILTCGPCMTGIRAGLTMNHFWAFWQFAAVGFWEEFGFRGYLQTRLCAWLGRWQGWLAASVMMALIHIPHRVMMSGFDATTAFLSAASLIPISLWMGFLMLRTDNIAAPAISHTFADWFGTLM